MCFLKIDGCPIDNYPKLVGCYMLKCINYLFSIYFNFRYLPFKQACHLPIFVNTFCLGRCNIRRGQLVLLECGRGRIRLGDGKSPGMQSFKTRILLGKDSKLVFRGSAVIAQGTVMRCDDGATISFGDNFYCNCNCYFRSTKSITFGNGCSLGWNVMMNTSDGHKVWHDGEEVRKDGSIIIGNHVWITANCSILKNVYVPDDCIIANNALVNKSFSQSHCLIGGLPARIIKTNVDWQV